MKSKKSSGNRSGKSRELGALSARPAASESLQKELQQEGSEQMDTGTTGEAEETRKENSSPLTHLEVTSGSTEATSGSADATSGGPRRAREIWRILLP